MDFLVLKIVYNNSNLNLINNIYRVLNKMDPFIVIAALYSVNLHLNIHSEIQLVFKNHPDNNVDIPVYVFRDHKE